MPDLHARLQRCFTAVFPDLTPDEIVRASQASIPQWDSLAGATLLAVVEEEFDRSIEDEALEDFTSYTSILAYLEVCDVS